MARAIFLATQATAERLRGDNQKEQAFIKQLPSNMRVGCTSPCGPV